MAYNDEMLRLVDERVAAALALAPVRIAQPGTVVSYTPGQVRAMVVSDGSTLAVPVKVMGNVGLEPGHRVGLVRFGADWTVVGTYSQQRGPFYLARQTIAQPIANLSWAGLLMDTIDADTHSGRDPLDFAVYRPPLPGYYNVEGVGTIALNAAGQRAIAVQVNNDRMWKLQIGPAPGGGTGMKTGGEVYCNGTTDVIRIVVLQGSGGSLDTQVAEDGPAPASNPRVSIRYDRPGP